MIARAAPIPVLVSAISIVAITLLLNIEDEVTIAPPPR
jgi:hypothetical protein